MLKLYWEGVLSHSAEIHHAIKQCYMFVRSPATIGPDQFVQKQKACNWKQDRFKQVDVCSPAKLGPDQFIHQ